MSWLVLLASLGTVGVLGLGGDQLVARNPRPRRLRRRRPPPSRRPFSPPRLVWFDEPPPAPPGKRRKVVLNPWPDTPGIAWSFSRRKKWASYANTVRRGVLQRFTHVVGPDATFADLDPDSRLPDLFRWLRHFSYDARDLDRLKAIRLRHGERAAVDVAWRLIGDLSEHHYF